jgi:hypothetical protein
MNQTSVEWLQAEFNKWAEDKVFIPQDLLEEAKRLEKEQIMMAFNDGKVNSVLKKRDSKEYYNQTYNQKIPEFLYKDGTPMRKVKLGKEAQELLDEATKRFNQPNL